MKLVLVRRGDKLPKTTIMQYNMTVMLYTLCER